MKKYELDKTSKIICSETGVDLYRVKALVSFKTNIADVEKFDLGGFVASESNLSQEGSCWVFDEARVYESAVVYGDAVVYDEAKVFENAKVGGMATIFEDCKVYGDVRVYDSAVIRGSSHVYASGDIFENAEIAGYSIISGSGVEIRGNALLVDTRVSDDVSISGDTEVRGMSIPGPNRIWGSVDIIGDEGVLEGGIDLSFSNGIFRAYFQDGIWLGDACEFYFYFTRDEKGDVWVRFSLTELSLDEFEAIMVKSNIAEDKCNMKSIIEIALGTI